MASPGTHGRLAVAGWIEAPGQPASTPSLKPMLTRDLQEEECLARPVEFLAEEDRAARRLVDQL
jgi:hypothetical protein